MPPLKLVRCRHLVGGFPCLVCPVSMACLISSLSHLWHYMALQSYQPQVDPVQLNWDYMAGQHWQPSPAQKQGQQILTIGVSKKHVCIYIYIYTHIIYYYATISYIVLYIYIFPYILHRFQYKDSQITINYWLVIYQWYINPMDMCIYIYRSQFIH